MVGANGTTDVKPFGDPCLPTRAEVAPTGAGWVHEINHNGHRPDG